MKSTPDSINPLRKWTFLDNRSSLAITKVAFDRFACASAFLNSGRSDRLPLSTSV
jgi:hypothetical protein